MIKSYTDLEQSKKLADILPLESADMVLPFRHPKKDKYIPGYVVSRNYVEVYNEMMKLPGMGKEDVCQLIQPAWSLSALLTVLPPYLYEWEKGIDFSLYPSVAKKRWWCVGYISQDLSPENKDKFTLITHADNPVDACVAMIEKLHELKML